jgi:hypothetical protein
MSIKIRVLISEKLSTAPMLSPKDILESARKKSII